MDEIEIIRELPVESSDFIKPRRIEYKQAGLTKTWDMVSVHDSVAVIILNVQTDRLVLVRQLRPSVYYNTGIAETYELCAGIKDKDMPAVQVAREEIIEETGYDVNVENISKVTSFFTAISFAGSRQELFYTEVDNSMRKSKGGGVGSEKIDVIDLPVSEMRSFCLDETKAKTPGLMFAFYWLSVQGFFRERYGDIAAV